MLGVVLVVLIDEMEVVELKYYYYIEIIILWGQFVFLNDYDELGA